MRKPKAYVDTKSRKNEPNAVRKVADNWREVADKWREVADNWIFTGSLKYRKIIVNLLRICCASRKRVNLL